MASYIWVTFAIIFLHLTCRASLARDNSTSLSENKSGNNMTALNSTDALANCTLKKNESAIKDILRFHYDYTTHVVEIKVSITSRNETRNLPQLVFPWANEIGRTIISLIERSNSFFLGHCGYHKYFLSVGIEQLDVFFSEENYGCLSNRSEGSELVFDFLLHQLSHSDDTHDYKLCRAFSTEKRYNCCRITGGRNLTICAEYSSLAVKAGEKAILAITILIFLFGLPPVIYYLRGYQDERKNYSIADSPLAFSTIFHTLFIDGQGRIKSPCRQFVFWLTTKVIVMLISSCLTSYIMFFSSLIIPYTWLDIFRMSHSDRQTDLYDAYIRCFTLPWNVKFWWNIFKPTFSASRSNWAKILVVLFSICLFPVVFISVVLYNFFFLLYMIFIYTTSLPILWKSKCHREVLIVPLQIIALIELMYVAATLIFLMLLLVVAVYLNAEYYGPTVLVLTGLIVYCFKHWRSFVESKYLVLKTNIYEVCKELNERLDVSPQNPQDITVEVTADEDPEGVVPPSSQNRQEISCFTVNVAANEIPKDLYNTIREKILPYDRILFYFFIKMLFVGMFFLLLYGMMLLAQKSNISGPAQIISSLILSTIPFTFDTILAEDTFEQKDANKKDQLHKILKMIDSRKIGCDRIELIVKTDKREQTVINNYEEFLKAHVRSRIKAGTGTRKRCSNEGKTSAYIEGEKT